MRTAPLLSLCLGWLVVLIGNGCGSAGAQPATDAPDRAIRGAPWQGLWTGRGVTFEKLMDDPVRKLSRQSETDFWFVIDADGRIHGEGFIAYQASLQAMKWNVPLPNGGAIDAQVEGSAPKRFFKIGITGEVLDAETGERRGEQGLDRNLPVKLRLLATGNNEDGEAAPEEEAVIPGIEFEFTIDASVTIPAGAGGTVVAPEAAPNLISIPLQAKGWSPFQGFTPTATAGTNEPYRVAAESSGEKHHVLWYAFQQSLPRQE